MMIFYNRRMKKITRYDEIKISAYSKAQADNILKELVINPEEWDFLPAPIIEQEEY